MKMYDAIVCGSGITGGWAAKELTERGLKVLLVERGPDLKHRIDYKTENKAPWDLDFRGYSDPKVLNSSKRIQKHAKMDEWVQEMYVDDTKEVYETPASSNFKWLRGYHLGGRSLMWGRHCYRMSKTNFEANEHDGYGIPWPVKYEDIAPWYDYVEKYIGVNGSKDNLDILPDGIYQPTMGFNKVEELFAKKLSETYDDRVAIPGRTANLTANIGDRIKCQNRSQCARGCSFGAYFSTQSSTLPAAQATGRLEIMADSIVKTLIFDENLKKVTGVEVFDSKKNKIEKLFSKIVFICTGSVNSVSLLLRSTSKSNPNGLGNSSGLLGHYFNDHAFGLPVSTTVPGLENWYYHGRKPNGIIIPRFVNIKSRENFKRGYSYQGFSGRQSWNKAFNQVGIGNDFKKSIQKPGDWTIGFHVSIETLPRKENKISLNHNKLDSHGMPLTVIDLRWSDNELSAAEHADKELRSMLSLLKGKVSGPVATLEPPGSAIHEMGGACMGADSKKSVTNSHNQLHDYKNVFITDGAFMNSSGDRNPSLTYMAFTARAAAYAAQLFKNGEFN